ncbi:hypothetical protein [Klebsiella pneumoniae]|uniref:Y-family DNA polymerase n=1 Tax=Klebsiella pneumoniae TaxID=573 RepID=UPI002265AF0D|nr:hypothetical protein [Klebsiella pneumoniae]
MFAGRCERFYASCERVFRPDLKGKPIVVLSNDGMCSQCRGEATGSKWNSVVSDKRKIPGKIYAFSSNYELYASISARVMNCTELAPRWNSIQLMRCSST